MTSIAKIVAAFIAAYMGGLDAIKKAAEIYVDFVSRNPDLRDEFQNRVKIISKHAWPLLARVGNGYALPEFIMLQGHAGYNGLSRCEIGVQKKYLNKRNELPVVVKEGKRFKTYSVNVESLDSRNLAAQVFGERSIRTAKEQVLYIKSEEIAARHRTQAQAVREEVHTEIYSKSFMVSNGFVRFFDTNKKYGVKEIEDILKKMKKKANIEG